MKKRGAGREKRVDKTPDHFPITDTVEEFFQSENNHAREQSHWMVTYSDLVTVVLVFFVMLQVISSFNPAKFNALFNKNLEVPIEAEPLNDQEARALELLKDVEEPEETLNLLKKLGGARELLKLLDSLNNTREVDRLLRLVKRDIRRNNLQFSVSATTDADHTMVIIHIRSGLLFDSGSATLSKSAYRTVDKIIEIIRPYDKFNVNIRGHTDSVPINTLQFPSNWELSAVRATSLLRYVVESGLIEPSRMTATGFGDLLPIAENDNASGRAQNRRVEFILQKFVR